MKKLLIICLFFTTCALPCSARDFIVEFVEENYKETQAQFSYTPLIYHSIQVNSSAGPKLLVLKGSDYNYRKWLRHYIAHNKKFITKVQDDKTDLFISSKAFEIDVTSLHPFNGDKWVKAPMNSDPQNTFSGNNNILLLDPNTKRSQLIKTIVQKMGYRLVTFKTGEQAFKSFKLQPEKFKMIISQYDISGEPSSALIEQILKVNHTIPIIIDTGYNNQKAENEIKTKFSNHRTVHLKPVILNNLEKTIETLIKKSA